MQNKLSSSVKVVFRYACKLMNEHPQNHSLGQDTTSVSLSILGPNTIPHLH